ncbi:MAG: folylpolyglutamate synthase/dihydrofolate synthase family protein [bacterium]
MIWRKTYLLKYLESLEKFGINLGLDRVRLLLEKLGNPQTKFKSIHIAGTNGKGSTACMIASILREAGYKVGLYTSPHLLDWRERFKVDGKDISKKEFAEGVRKIKGISRRIKGNQGVPTVFEVTTALAFWYFAKKKVDYAVVEVGLGGRLDATNVIIPEVSVITNIELEHTEILGKTLTKIAKEKAAIIKPGVPVVTGERKQGTSRVIREEAKRKGCKLTIVKTNLSTRDGYQKLNRACAVAAIKAAKIRITNHEIRRGLAGADWPGRLQIVSKRPLVIVDGAHNPAGIKALVSTLKAEYTNKFTIVFGCQKTKASKAMIRLLKPINQHLIITQSSHDKAASFPGATKNIKQALKQWDQKSPLLITGSLFLVADALRIMS